MGVKSKAALAIVVLLLFLGSLWLREYLPLFLSCTSILLNPSLVESTYAKHQECVTWGTPCRSARGGHCCLWRGFQSMREGGLDYHWDSCIKGYNQVNKLHHLSNNSEATALDGSVLIEVCPGQNFQVSRLLSQLLAGPTDPSDILLEPYLASWDELVKFMEALGPMVGLISAEIKSKTTIIRQLASSPEDNSEAELNPEIFPMKAAPELKVSAHMPAYRSVRSMIHVELEKEMVDFQQQTDSGCRTLLRLHRALLWLKLFLEKLADVPVTGRLRSPSDLCREAYQKSLANHHTWFVRRAAELAFIAMPERTFFFRLVCVQDQEELSIRLTKVVQALDEVYNRTQIALEEHGMLDLP